MNTIGKSRKMTLGSLFKRSGTDELRSSSKERGSSRSKKKKSDTTELNVHVSFYYLAAVYIECVSYMYFNVFITSY